MADNFAAPQLDADDLHAREIVSKVLVQTHGEIEFLVRVELEKVIADSTRMAREGTPITSIEIHSHDLILTMKPVRGQMRMRNMVAEALRMLAGKLGG